MLTDDLMTIRFTVKTIERLCDVLRSRSTTCAAEREIRKIVVDRCGMPQEHFIKTFPGNVLNLKLGREGDCAGQAAGPVLG